jgi:hypothetical protein
MPRQREEGKGALFSNNKEGKHPKAPDFTGEILINGNVIKLSAWKRQSAYGELISLQHNTYGEGKQPTYPREVKSKISEDDIPF